MANEEGLPFSPSARREEALWELALSSSHTFCDKCTGRAAWLSCPPEAALPGRSHTHPRL